jgi:hypothetical protein
MAARFPVAIASIAAPGAFGGPVVSLAGNAKAVLLDADGQCMFAGSITSLDAATRTVMLPGSGTLPSNGGWSCWRLLDGTRLSRPQRDDGDGDGGNGVSEPCSTALQWVWCIRDRARALLPNALLVRTAEDQMHTDDLDARMHGAHAAPNMCPATLHVPFRDVDAHLADLLKHHLLTCAGQFNNQVGLCMRATVSSTADARAQECSVVLRVARASPVPGPRVHPHRRLETLL